VADFTGTFALRAAVCAGVALAAGAAAAQDDSADLAKKLSNPVAAMISVPFQYNYDEKIGPDEDGHKNVVNFQPVVPIRLDGDWNLISRTILPLVDQHHVAGAGSQSGIGDITQSFFFSPSKPTANGIIWGAGPVLLLPTGSDDALSARKWGLGPTAVVLKQEGEWTYGALVNHIWSVAGDGDRANINSTFLQPFLSYTTPDAWTYTLNTESTYDWRARQWGVPINAMISKLVKIDGHPVSFAGGVRYWAESGDAGPRGWGARFVVTFLFPE
jgi:hypothetical protein